MRQEIIDFRNQMQSATSKEEAQLIANQLHSFVKTLSEEEEQTTFKEGAKTRVKSKLNLIEKLFDIFEAVRQYQLNFA